MKIELRNVKYAAFASEETSCFEATIYVDGKREGTARNDGKGGMTFIEPRALEQRLNAHAATLPEVDLGEAVGDSRMMKQTGEWIVDDLLAQHLITQDLKRLLRGYILTMKGGRIYQTRAGRKEMLGELVERLRTEPHEQVLQRFGAEHVLNLMPFDEALRLFRAGTA